jgi:hypothetical protein
MRLKAARTRTGAEHDWNYSTPENPAPEEVAMESNRAGGRYRPGTGTVLAKKGEAQHLRICVMTAPPPAAAGSLPVAGRRKQPDGQPR